MSNEELTSIKKRLDALENLIARLVRALESEGIHLRQDPEDQKAIIRAASKAQLGF
jgi:hypothetical protein